MKKAVITSCFLLLLFGFGHVVGASYDNGGSLDYVPDSQSFGIHTKTPPEALTLNGYFALKELTSDDAPASGYGNLYAKADGLYYYNGSLAFLLTNGISSVAANSLDFSEFKDDMSLDATTTIAMGASDINFDSDTLVIDSTANGVGIGTASPVTPLQVVGTVTATLFNGSGSGLTALPVDVMALDDLSDAEVTANTLVVGSGTSSNGSYNTALGLSTLANTQSQALYNTAVGYQAQYSLVGAAGASGDSNTAVGKEALYLNLTGYSNTAVGAEALRYNIAHSNTAIGTNALFTNNGGASNTAIGKDALYANQEGNYNTAVGIDALEANTNGSYNIAIGYKALDVNTTADQNIAIGRDAMSLNTTGSNNVAIGPRNVLVVNTTGSNNIALGGLTLDANTTGSNNVAVGRGAMGASVNGDYNLALGSDALTGPNEGDYNIALGYQSLNVNKEGGSNLALGRGSLSLNTNGNYNVAVGRSAASNVTTGSSNIMIGYDVDAPSATADDQLSIGNLIFGTGLDGRGTVKSSGNIGIGDSSPESKLKVNGQVLAISFNGDGSALTGLGSSNGNDLDWDDFADAMTLDATTTIAMGANDINFDSDTLVIDSTANGVGIGTTTPRARLEIEIDSATVNGLVIEANSTQSSNLIEIYNNGGNLRAHINEDAEFSNTGGRTGTEVFGDGATANGTNSVIIGYGATGATGSGYAGNNVVIGASASATSKDNVVIGKSAQATDFRNTVIGFGASSDDEYSIALGYDADASGYNSIAINADTGAGYSVAIGGSTTGGHEVALGIGASTAGSESIAIGRQANAGYEESIAIGYQATATATNQFVVASQSGITDFYIGRSGPISTAPLANATIHATGGNGDDIDATNLIFAAGQGTGNGDGGDLIFQTAKPGVDGNLVNALSERMRITDNGNVSIGTTNNDGILTLEGVLAMDEVAAPSAGSGYGKIYVGTDSNLYFLSDTGATTMLSNGSFGAESIQSNSLDFSEFKDAMTLDATTTIDLDGNDLNINGGLLMLDDSTERVGIGTLSPAHVLDVDGNVGFGNRIYMNNGATQIIYYAGHSGAGMDNSLVIGNAGANMNSPNTTKGEHNTLVGIGAGFNAYEAYNNTAVGSNALYSLNNGSTNVAIGSTALYKTTDGGKNIALGSAAMYNNTNGNSNVALGYAALSANLTGDDNIALGEDSLKDNTIGANNIATGAFALQNNTNGNSNIAIGANALANNILGTGSIAIGSAAGYVNKSSYITAIGYDSQRNNTQGTGTVSMGYRSLYSNVTGNSSTAVGYRALYASNGDYNTGLGYEAGDLVSEGENNTVLGYRAGDNITTGSSNIIIGASVDAPEVDEDSQLNIGNTIYADMSNDQVSIGTTNNDGILTLEGVLAMDEVSAPSAGSGYGKIYVGTDSNLYFLSDTGATTMLSNGTSNVSAGGSDGQIQFNNSNSFDGSANYTWDDANNQVYLNGNFGIGNGNPAELLVVSSAAALDGSDPPTIKIESSRSSGTWTAGGDVANLDFHSQDTSGWNGDSARARISMYTGATNGGNYGLKFLTDPGSTQGLTEVMRMDMYGRVGIGTTSPAADLSVSNGAMSNIDGTDDILVKGDIEINGIYYGNGSGLTDINPSEVTSASSNQVLYINGSGNIVGDSDLVFDGATTSATRVRTGDGSQGTPPHSFTSDTDTGMYSAGSDKLGFVTGGTHRLIITSVGNVGIGDLSPDRKLEVDGQIFAEGGILVNGDNSSLNSVAYGFWNDVNTGVHHPTENEISLVTGGVNRVYVDSGGSVGIGGITSPANTLHVNGTVQVNQAIVFDEEVDNTSAGSITVNWDLGNKQVISLANDNVTIKFKKFTDDKVASVSLVIIQNGGNMDVTTWEGFTSDVDIKWPGGTAPDLSDGDDDIDVINCLYHPNSHTDNGEFLCTPSFDFLE